MLKPRLFFSLLVLVAPSLSGARAQAQQAQAAQNPVEVSTQRLKVIHKALVAYEKKNRHWPDHLSDLVPEFLPDKEALRDPADNGTGDLGSNLAHKDPAFPVSYSYERNAKESNGLPDPLGPFPAPDLGSPIGWGSWRLVNQHQEYFFGDQVPLVRCYLHRPSEEDREEGKDLVLNLTPTGRVYRSDFDWKQHPDSVGFMLQTLLRDLTQGGNHVTRRWLLFRVEAYLRDIPAGTHGDKMRALAKALFSRREELPEGQRIACKIAADLHFKVGEFQKTLAILDVSDKYEGPDWYPVVEDQLRARACHELKLWHQEIAIYERLLEGRPNTRGYMESLAEAYASAGQPDKAAEWRRKADPAAALIGKAAPEFRLPLLDGRMVTLAEARQGKKALLLNFWFCGCAPCRLEFPHLQQLYKDYQAKGLAILAVNFGDSHEAIQKFIKDQITFTIGVGKGENDQANPVFAAYEVTGYPTTYIIDSEGKIIARHIGFGSDWKRDVPAALARLGVK